MKTSPYSRLVELPNPTADGMTHVAYSTLTGTALGVPREVAEVLARGREGPIDARAAGPVDSETLRYLVDRGWLIEDDGAESDRIEAARREIRRHLGELGEYGVVPWPEMDAPFEPSHALDVIFALAEVEARRHRHYRFYALSERDVSRLPDMAGALEAHWESLPAAEEGRRLLILTIDPAAEVDWASWSFLRAGEGRLCLPIHPSLARDRPFGDWIRAAAGTAAAAAQVGFSSWIIIHATPGDPDGWLDTALVALTGTGLLYTCARLFCFVAKRSVDDWRDYLCELDDIDFDLLERALREASRSRRRSLLHLHGGGIVHKGNSMLTQREPLVPELFYCTSIPAGYHANLAGEVWPCPKMAAGLGREAGAEPMAIYGDGGLRPNPSAASRWRGREVTAIEGCRGCVGMLACAGGCALEAARAHGGDPLHPSCQPVERFMETLIRTQERRLTRAFGPRPARTR